MTTSPTSRADATGATERRGMLLAKAVIGHFRAIHSYGYKDNRLYCRFCNTDGFADHKSDCVVLLARSALSKDNEHMAEAMREEIARIIDPAVFAKPRANLHRERYEMAFAKADEIIALRSALSKDNEHG